jgi:hypothetical protein
MDNQFACRFALHVLTKYDWVHNDDLIYLFMHGGPSLPLVGGSVFYYLFVLVCLSALVILFRAIPVSPRRLYVLAYVTVFLCLCYFQWLNWHGRKIPYWRLDNFLIYVPLAYIVWQQHERVWRAGTVTILFVCFVLFAIQDIYIRNYIWSTGTGIYSRALVVFGSVTIFMFLRVIYPRIKNPSGVATFLATYSLGIFAIHKYWQDHQCDLRGDQQQDPDDQDHGVWLPKPGSLSGCDLLPLRWSRPLSSTRSPMITRPQDVVGTHTGSGSGILLYLVI